MRTLDSSGPSSTTAQSYSDPFNATSAFPTSVAKASHELTLLQRSRGADGSNDGKVKGEDTTVDNRGISAKVDGAKDQEDESKYPGGVALTIITIGLMLAAFVVALDNTIIGE